MRPYTPLVLAGTLACLAAGPSFAQCRAASGAGTGALVELFTSEGCSSCPPAERWLAGLPAGEIAAGRLVPIALHVAYWDYLGWKDPYAMPAALERQTEYKRLAAARYVYTPQVVLAGRDFRSWSNAGLTESARRINAEPSRATLALTLQDRPDGMVQVDATATVPAPADRPNAALYVALVQSGLVSQVKAGENRGAKLEHAHVAREWLGPFAIDPQGRATVAKSLKRPTGAPSLGLVAFVQNATSGNVLQSLALPDCR